MKKVTAKLAGNSVVATKSGIDQTFVCKDRETATHLREAIGWLQVIPDEINADAGYTNDSWGSTLPEHKPDRYSEVKRLVLRWDRAGVIQKVAVVDGVEGRDKIREEWDKEKAAAEKTDKVNLVEAEIPKNGFISKPVYRVEPLNGKSYWFAERYLNGKKTGCDMRCANKSIAEALCASDMRHGRAISAMSQGHFPESGDRYIRMEQGLVTECHDAGSPSENYAYRDERAKEYGDCKYSANGVIADPDPEPTVEAKPEAKEAELPKEWPTVENTLKAVQKEVADGQRAFFNTGVIPRPSEVMLSGYEKGCGCGICAHIESWRKQELEAAKKTEQVNKMADALQQLSQDIATKKSPDEKDARVGEVTANVKQVNTSNETNKENQAMANNEKPTVDTKPARQPSQIELEARAAALRTGMKQLTKLIHEPLAAALAAQLTPPGSDPSAMKAQVAAFLKSELGSAVVSAMLSLAINSIPANMIPGFTAERQSLVAQELRVKAMTEVGDTLVDLVAAPLRAALAGLMTGPGAEALTGVRAEDAGLDGASTAQEEATTAAQVDNVKRVNFG